MITAVLTIPSQQHRVWSLMGHLHTLGFPVMSNSRMRIYNGFDYADYGSRREAFEALSADGHDKYQRYIEENGHNPKLMSPNAHMDMCEWGILNIMRKIVEEDHAMLVIENDAFFRNLPVTDVEDSFEFLFSQWKDLIYRVGYENINVAMFTVIRPNLEDTKSKAPLEDVSDFWVKGACSTGQTANIYTPNGARIILEDKPCSPNVEAWLYHGENTDGSYGNIPNIYSSREGIISLHFFSNFDSPHTAWDIEWAWEHYKGAQL